MPEEALPKPIPKYEAPARALETDMDRLAGEIMKHKENPEMAGAGDREIVRQAIRSIGPMPSVQPAPAQPSPYLPNYVANAPPATKLEIEYLVEMAFKEGIAKANAAALKSNPFVLDAFHDVLVGKLYPELQKRKIVN